MTSETLGWELERSAIFIRWDAARRSGEIVWSGGDEDSFGAFPEEMQRYRELNNRMETYLATPPPLHLARGTFELGSKRVQWDSLGSVQSRKQGRKSGPDDEIG